MFSRSSGPLRISLCPLRVVMPSASFHRNFALFPRLSAPSALRDGLPLREQVERAADQRASERVTGISPPNSPGKGSRGRRPCVAPQTPGQLVQRPERAFALLRGEPSQRPSRADAGVRMPARLSRRLAWPHMVTGSDEPSALAAAGLGLAPLRYRSWILLRLCPREGALRLNALL